MGVHVIYEITEMQIVNLWVCSAAACRPYKIAWNFFYTGIAQRHVRQRKFGWFDEIENSEDFDAIYSLYGLLTTVSLP